MLTVIRSEIHETFCEAIKARRRELGLTQAELAERLGVHAATVAQAEAGKREPTISTVQRYADALETTVGELLGQHAPVAH